MKFPSNAFAVVFDPAVETAMYELLEDRHGSMVPGNSPTEESPAENPYINHPTNQPIQFLGEQIQLDSLTKSDLVTIGKKHGYDYILFLPFYLAYEYSKTTWVTSFRKTAIVLRAKMVDVKRANYLLRKDFVQIGDSGTVFPSLFGISSLTRTARKAMNRCLLQSLNEIPIGEEIDIPQNELDYGDKW